jgi:hypothetical protein
VSYSEEHNAVIIEAIADVTPLHADELRSVARRVRLMNHELDTVRENMKAAELLIAAQRDELDALKAGR